MKVISDDEKGIFAITREWENQTITLFAHGKSGDIRVEEFPTLTEFIGMENLLTNKQFSGNLSTFELAVFVKK